MAAEILARQAFTWKSLPPLPEPLGVAAPFAGVCGGSLLVAGGANFPGKMPWEGGKKVWDDRIWLLEKPGGDWHAAGRLPHPIGYGVSVTWHDELLCVGGSNAERHFSDAFRLVWKENRPVIEDLPALPIALSGASGALVGDLFYIAGGSEAPGEQSATNRAFCLDLARQNPSWHELPPLPSRPRLLAAGAAHDGAFYLFGGAALEPDGSGKIVRRSLREAWRYRPEHGWQRLADLPRPSVAAPSPAPVINGRILLLAGDDGSNFQPVEKHPGFPDDILVYDPKLDRWEEGERIPAPRVTVPCVEWLGLFVIPSGEMRPGVRSPEVRALSPR